MAPPATAFRELRYLAAPAARVLLEPAAPTARALLEASIEAPAARACLEPAPPTVRAHLEAGMEGLACLAAPAARPSLEPAPPNVRALLQADLEKRRGLEISPRPCYGFPFSIEAIRGQVVSYCDRFLLFLGSPPASEVGMILPPRSYSLAVRSRALSEMTICGRVGWQCELRGSCGVDGDYPQPQALSSSALRYCSCNLWHPEGGAGPPRMYGLGFPRSVSGADGWDGNASNAKVVAPTVTTRSPRPSPPLLYATGPALYGIQKRPCIHTKGTKGCRPHHTWAWTPWEPRRPPNARLVTVEDVASLLKEIDPNSEDAFKIKRLFLKKFYADVDTVPVRMTLQLILAEVQDTNKHVKKGHKKWEHSRLQGKK